MNLNPKSEITNNQEPFVTGYFDAFGGVHEVYLRSSTLTQARNMGPRIGFLGTDRDTLARIPITTDHGAVLSWSANGYSYAWSSIPYLAAKQLDFVITDADGNVIDLHGGNVSFHVILHNSP